MENSKRKNIYIVIFIITTIIAGSLAMYFGVVANNKQQELDKQVASVKENASDEATNNVAENNVQIKEVEKIVEKSIIPKFDPDKMKNKPNNVTYNIDRPILNNNAFDRLSYEYNSDGTIKAKLYSNEGDFNKSKDIKINGISGKVIDVCESILADGANGAIAFLTENGDVYFADNIDKVIYDNKEIINAEKVKSVSNVCKIFANVSKRNGSYNRGTLIAIDTTGYCYDLWYECKGIN